MNLARPDYPARSAGAGIPGASSTARPEIGRVQPFATQEDAELPRLPARVDGDEDLEFIRRTELATGPGR